MAHTSTGMLLKGNHKTTEHTDIGATLTKRRTLSGGKLGGIKCLVDERVCVHLRDAAEHKRGEYVRDCESDWGGLSFNTA